MDNKQNTIISGTGLIEKLIYILFLERPKETTLGGGLGYVIYFTIKIFKPYLNNLSTIIDIQNIPVAEWILFGAITVNVPSLFKKRKLSPEVEDTLIVIDRIKRDKEISKLEITSMYRRLYDKVLTNVTLDKDTALNAHDLAKQFAEADTKSGGPGISA